MKKHLVLLGPPGAGKDTQGKILSSRLGIPLISSGELIRKEVEEKTAFGLKFKEMTEKGFLVPDSFMNEFFDNVLGRYNLKDGYILNGYPRTLNQAEHLNEYLSKKEAPIDAVLFLNVDFDMLVKRLSGRRICKNCGSVYNAYFDPPKVDNVCDKCGGELIQRKDDAVDAVKNRIEVYLRETQPLLDFYKKLGILFICDASFKVEEVEKQIFEAINDSN